MLRNNKKLPLFLVVFVFFYYVKSSDCFPERKIELSDCQMKAMFAALQEDQRGLRREIADLAAQMANQSAQIEKLMQHLERIKK